MIHSNDIVDRAHLLLSEHQIETIFVGGVKCACGLKFRPDAGWDEHYRNVVRDVVASVIDDVADAYPVLTRDMVSRGSVRDWLKERARSLRE